jgi:hypothetical protein
VFRIAHQFALPRCSRTGASCADITGVTRSSYKLTRADLGHELTVVVTATDHEHQAGHAAARAVGPVTA